MSGALLPRFSYCLCGDQAVFLDVTADRYFALPASQNRAFIEHITKEAGETGEWTATDKTLPANPELCRTIAPATNSLQTAPSTRADCAYVARAVMAYAAIAIRLKRRGFADVLQQSANRRPMGVALPSTQIYLRILAAFNALAPICGRAENCLPRSIAFHALAVTSGHCPSLVIGVKRDPFAAHCWVQDGQTVLNDRTEHVRIFTPILVI